MGSRLRGNDGAARLAAGPFCLYDSGKPAHLLTRQKST